MPDLRDQISQALKGHGADYVEVRIEEGESSGCFTGVGSWRTWG